MRDMHPDALELLSRDSLASVIFVSLGNDDTPVRFNWTTYYRDWQDINTGITYSSGKEIAATDPPRISDVLDKETFKVIVADSAYQYRADFANGAMTGAPMEVKGAFINTTDGNELDADPGEIYPNAVVVVYRGFIDEVAYAITPDEETVLEVNGSSPMGVLSSTRTILTSKNWMNQEHPGDTSYDQILEGSAKIKLLWGKKP